MSEIRTRIAPSPTGDPHVGTAYIALFNLAFAKKNNGKFILRIEDTDQGRSTSESEEMIFNSLNWLNLNYEEGPDISGDFGPYRQSERFHLYGKYADQLIDNHKAYHCFCTKHRLDNLRERQKAMKQAPGYDGHCRSLTSEEIQAKLDNKVPYVIRLKMPYDGNTIIKDRLRGDISFENSKIDDQILLKADGFPTYHLANVVDDHLMKITHVIRAEEWIASTPKHIQLYQAFGWEIPEFIHMPLLRNNDKTKISKRKNPVSLNWYKENGYLKEGIINFLGLMGYSFGENKEIFSLEEFIENFNIDNVSLGGPVFDLVKLGWVNNHHMRQKDIKELTKLARPFFEELGYITTASSEDELNTLERVVDILREGCATLKDIAINSDIYYNDDLSLPEVSENLNKKERKNINRMYESIQNNVGISAIKLFISKLENSSENLSPEEAKILLNSTLNEINEGPGKVLMPLRVVITANTKGSELYNVISIIGKTRTLYRITNMIKKYNIF